MSHTPEQQREFISLITKHQSSLRAYIISLMPGLPGASDVLQETNIVLWEKRENFQLDTNFIAWSYTIARFQVKNHRRKVFKHQKTNKTLDEDLAEDLAAYCALEPEASEKRIQALELCLANLRPEERELIQHRYLESASLGSYAESIGRSASSVSVTLYRIHQKLRKCVTARLNTFPINP